MEPEFLSRISAGDGLLLWFADDNVWHERVALWKHADDFTWFCLTPDGDLYAECLWNGDPSDSCTDCRPLQANRSLPRGLAGANVQTPGLAVGW